jgi:hypothetical protein
MLRRRDGTDVRKIADIADNAGILVDPGRKLVVYQKAFESATLGAIDVNTRQSRELALPTGRNIYLLDRSRDGTVAYSVEDSCVPDEVPAQTARKAAERPRVAYSNVVCFVKFP